MTTERAKPDTPWVDEALGEPVRRISMAEVEEIVANTTLTQLMKQEAEMLYFEELPADYYAKAFGRTHYWDLCGLCQP